MKEHTYQNDDLSQHKKDGRMRCIIIVLLLVAVVCLVFGIGGTMTALHIKEQKEQTELQAEQIRKQSLDIQAIADERQKQNEELTLRQALALAELADRYYEFGDSRNAVKTALEALTESDGIVMPYTPQAQYILTASTRAYDTGTAFKAAYQYEMASEIKYMDISPEKRVLAIGDATGRLVLFDLEQGKEIDTVFNRYNPKYFDAKQAFLAGGRFAYLEGDGRVVAIYDIEKKEVIQRLDCGYYNEVYADKEGKYLFVYEDKEGYVYAGDTLQHMVTIDIPDNVGYKSSCYVLTEGIIAMDCYNYVNDKNMHTLYFWNIESGQLISSHEIADKTLEDIQMRNGVVYALLSHYSNENRNWDTYVFAFSLESDEILWEDMKSGARPDLLCLPTNPDGLELACSTQDSISLINMQTGEIMAEWSLESKIIELYSGQNNNWFFIQESGELSVINQGYYYLSGMSYLFTCKSLRNAYAFLIPGYGIVIQEVKDNKITVYTDERGPKVNEISEEVKQPELPKEFSGSDAFNLASFYDFERPDYIYRMYHSEDEKYCIAYYWDGDMVIYDTEQRKVLKVFEDAIDTNWCLGTDAEGYTYLLAETGCYVLNKDMDIIAWIEDVQNVDVEKRMVYIKVDGKYYEAPIYSLEELIEIAQSKL